MKRKAWHLAVLCLAAGLPVMAGNDGWRIEAVNPEPYNGVTLANGRLGLVAGAGLFEVSEIVLGGVYDKECEGGVSRMVRAPLFTALSLKIDGKEVGRADLEGWRQVLDMKRACLETSAVYKGTKLRYTLRALRQLPYMALGEVEVIPAKDLVVEAVNRTVWPEELQDCTAHFKVLHDGSHVSPLLVSQARSRTGMQAIACCTSIIPDGEPLTDHSLRACEPGGMSFTRRIEAGTPFRFALVGAVCTSRDFSDPKNEAERMVVYALQHSADALVEGHERAWEELWRGDIVIEGCPEDQRDVRLALYHLYAFQREGSRLSISPMGLSSSAGYNGHIFWDSEMWMYPPVLALNPALAKAHVDYRADRLEAALRRARNYGFRGAMFPWESDDSGEEATPTWCLTGPLEHHISADVAIAFWNYYRATGDAAWLREEGWPVLRAVADFWVSRSQDNADGTCSIRNVVGADEYACNVDDNAFTNGAAKVALLAAVRAAGVLGERPEKDWVRVAAGLRFHYMDDGTTKEHADYDGEKVKQADVNLLAYPLGVVTEREQVWRDLNYYEGKIDKVNGPAMGFSILSVLSSRMGRADKAYDLFKRAYMPNRRPPFGVLSESPSSNNPYFATGAGGMLQAVIFGFGGLRLTDEGFVQEGAVLPEEWESLTIKGVGPERKTFSVRRPLPASCGEGSGNSGSD